MSSRKQDYLTALACKTLPERVPLWELHFHLWNMFCGENERFVSGPEFFKLSEAEQKETIKRDAYILAKVGQEIGFGAVSIPDAPWDCIYTLPAESRFQLISELRKLNPDFAIVCGMGGVFTMPGESDDYEEFCYRMYDEPEEIDQMCVDMYNDFESDAQKAVDAGIEAVYIPADIADTRAPFLTPAQAERWYFPYLTKCAEFWKARGVHPILHTDGNISTMLPRVRECGVEGLQAIDPISGMDIVETQKILAPNVAVCGNLDCGLMLGGTPDQVYDSAVRIINDCKTKPGFVFGNSNAVAIQSPLENYKAMLAAWREHQNIEASNA